MHPGYAWFTTNDIKINICVCLSRKKAELENQHQQHLAFLRQLESQKGQYAGELQRLEGEAEQLNRRALDLENQAKQARHAANERLHALKDAK